MAIRYIVAGGDMRSAALCRLLSEKADVYATGFDRSVFKDCEKSINLVRISEIPEKADRLILPLPVTNDGITLNCPFFNDIITLEEISCKVKKNGIVFGGKFSPGSTKIFTSKELTVTDYLEREEFAIMNALATAEGALQTAFEQQNTIISGSRIIITGMGRIAKSLIHILEGFGADITVCARKCTDLTWAEVLGCRTVRLCDIEKNPALSDADIIFNTVPSMIFDEKTLCRIKKNALIIDLASNPGGTDYKTAEKLGVRTVRALSLPGKTAPDSSGMAILKTIENTIHEMNISGKEKQ